MESWPAVTFNSKMLHDAPASASDSANELRLCLRGDRVLRWQKSTVKQKMH